MQLKFLIFPTLVALSLSFSSLAMAAGDNESWQVANEGGKKKTEIIIEGTPIPPPRFFEDHVVNGYKYLKEKKYNFAIEEFEQATTINPQYYLAYRGLGDTYRAMKKYKEALNYYKTAIKIINPRYFEGKLKLAENAERGKDLPKAASIYRYILGVKPEAGIQVLRGDAYISLAKGIENPQKPEAIAEKKKDEKEAEKAYNEAIKDDPKYADPHFKLGNIYYEGGKMPKAITEYDAAVKLFPQEGIYNYMLGMSYFRSAKKSKKIKEEDLVKAIKYLELAVKYRHTDKNLYFNIGNAYLEKGLIIHAIITTASQDIDKELLTIEKETAKVVKDNQKNNTYNRDNPAIKKSRAVIKEKQAIIDKNAPNAIGYYARAIRMYQIIMAPKEKDAEINYNIGNAYFKQGELVEKQMAKYQGYGDELKLDAVWKKTHSLYNNAIKYYRKALKTNQKYAEVWYDLGVVFYRKRCIKPDPDNLEILPHLVGTYGTKGLNYYYTDMADRSIKAFEKYITLNSDTKDPVKLKNLAKVKQLVEEISREAGLVKAKE